MRNLESRRKLETVTKEHASGWTWWQHYFGVARRLREAREKGVEPDPRDVAWAENYSATTGGKSVHEYDGI